MHPAIAANRAIKAARIARHLAWTVDDAREANDLDWRRAEKAAVTAPASPATRSAVTALLDVAAGRLRAPADADDPAMYNLTRKAAIITAAFRAAGLLDEEEPTEDQWELAARVGEQLTASRASGSVSPTCRSCVSALLSEAHPALDLAS